jgi:hypothetical protein
MIKNIELVRQLFAQTKANHFNSSETEWRDIDIIQIQQQLMISGSNILAAFCAGAMPDLLLSFMITAYISLFAYALSAEGVPNTVMAEHQDWSVLSVVKSVSERINRCCSGKAAEYVDLYTHCFQIVRGFINADFDKAFKIIHLQLLENIKHHPTLLKEKTNLYSLLMSEKAPDLSDCLYE